MVLFITELSQIDIRYKTRKHQSSLLVEDDLEQPADLLLAVLGFVGGGDGRVDQGEVGQDDVGEEHVDGLLLAAPHRGPEALEDGGLVEGRALAGHEEDQQGLAWKVMRVWEAIVVHAKAIGYHVVTSLIPPSDLPTLSVVGEGEATISIKH